MQKAKTLAIHTVSHNWHMIFFMCFCLMFVVLLKVLSDCCCRAVVVFFLIVAAAFAFEVFVIFGKSVESDLWRPHTLIILFFIFFFFIFYCCSCWSGLVYNKYSVG